MAFEVPFAILKRRSALVAEHPACGSFAISAAQGRRVTPGQEQSLMAGNFLAS
jgi:hypothetical protein